MFIITTVIIIIIIIIIWLTDFASCDWSISGP